MTIAPITDGEGVTSATGKINAAFALLNAGNPPPDAISYTGDPTKLSISLSQSRVNLGSKTYAGLTAVDASPSPDGILSVDFGAVEIYRGVMMGSPPALTSLAMPNAKVIITTANDGTISGTFAALTDLDLSAVELIDGEFRITANSLTSLDLGSLTTAHGALGFRVNGATSIDLSALEEIVFGNFTATFNALTTLDLSSFRKGDLGFSADLLTSIDVSAYEDDNDLGVTFYAPALTSFSMPAIKYLRGGVFLNNCVPSLTTFSMGAGLLESNDFNMTGSAMNAASVNGILVRLAALDGTGGTVLFENKTVDLSGGTAASPSGAGLTAKATLEGRGNTVTVN